MPEQVEIKRFAERVERLCDFLISKFTGTHHNGSDDLRVLKDLKEEAARIQFGWVESMETIEGLDDFMRGIPHVDALKLKE